jgi:rhamnosyltransferase
LKKASIIVRTKNEEKWIVSCLKAVFAQDYGNFEVIIVDNNSTDKTIEKIKQFDVKLITLEKYLPGLALNVGIREADGEFIVCLSGHCIPVNNQWLSQLLLPMEDPKVAGVYGRQEPMSFTSDMDKRDLMLVFGLDPKRQTKDPFFHNANSALRKELWGNDPFDEETTNIEDRIWGKRMIDLEYSLFYQPSSKVYHYHGIHQEGNPERCRNVVKILEKLHQEQLDNKEAILNVDELNIVALIPVKGEIPTCGQQSLLDYTLQRAFSSKFIKQVIVLTDNEEVAESSRKQGADVPFIRDPELSKEYVDLGMVLKYCLEQLEEKAILADLFVIMEVTYPFRSSGLIDDLILRTLRGGFDSLVPVKKESRTVWSQTDVNTALLQNSAFMPRQFKNPNYIGLLGLGSVTHPQFIRQGEILGDKTGIVTISDPYSQMEVRDTESTNYASKFIDEWWSKETKFQ